MSAEVMHGKRLLALLDAEPVAHKWDRDGERCVRCGAKDWMGGECARPEASDAEPVAWIPMSEGRIPEPTPYPDGKSYRVALVALNDGSGVYLSEAMYDEGEGKWLTAGGVPESHFTHWRPFPAPPGGQR